MDLLYCALLRKDILAELTIEPMKNIVGSTNGWCKISNPIGFLKQANKSKSHKNTLQSQTNDKIVITVRGGSIYVGMIFLANLTLK